MKIDIGGLSSISVYKTRLEQLQLHRKRENELGLAAVKADGFRTVMTKFFLNIRNRDEFIRDEEGGDYLDLATARAEAELAIRQIVAGNILQGRIVDRRWIEITNESGQVVDIVPFRMAIRFD